MHFRTPSRRGQQRRATATVELALILPILCFLFVVAVDYARIFYFSITLENCARNGAYYASNYPNNNYLYNDIYGYKTMDDAVLSDATNLCDAANPANNPTYTVAYSTNPSGPFTLTTEPSSGGYVLVTAKWTFNTLTNYPGIPQQVLLLKAVSMKIAPAMPTFP